ncbi:hypothetical protein BJX65DRAFT_273986 [Aspergillus insuetus]
MRLITLSSSLIEYEYGRLLVPAAITLCCLLLSGRSHESVCTAPLDLHCAGRVRNGTGYLDTIYLEGSEVKEGRGPPCLSLIA